VVPIRRAVVSSLLAAPLVVGGGWALLRTLPELVRGQLADRLKARTGLDATIGEVAVGFGSIEIAQLQCGVAPGPRVSAHGVAVEANALMLALRGSAAIDSLRIGKLVVTVPIGAPSTTTLLARLGGATPTAVRDDASTARPQSHAKIVIDDLQLDATDALGTLASVRGGHVTRDGDGLQASVKEVRLGGGKNSDELHATGITAALRNDGMLRLTKLVAARLELIARAATPAPTPAPKPVPRAEDDDDAPDEPPEPAPPPSLLSRLLAARDALSAARASAPAQAKDPATGPPSKPSASPKPASRLASGAVLQLDDGVMLSAAGGAPVMQGLRAKAVVRPDGALAFTGEAAARSGSMHWDLVLRPEAAQADGRLDVHSMPLDLLSPFLPFIPWYEPHNGRLDANLVVATEPGDSVRFEGQIALREVALSSPRIAPTPVLGIEVALDGRGRFLPLQRRVELQTSTLRIADVAMEVTGAAERTSDHYLLDVDAVMPQTPCTTAVRAIPEDLLGDMSLATWQGKIGGTVKLRLDSRKLQETVLELEPQDHCEFVTVPAMADLRRFQQPFVHFVEEPDGTTFEMETGPGTAAWAYIEDISPFFVHAVLAHEDAGFFTHHGFSLPHVRNALVRNLQEGRYVVGASTITMQLVKNVFLHREKTLARKIQEVLLTWWIERVMDKRDVLELYLNVIEYGPGIYGIRNGARHYFNRLPSQLSPAESVFLATILPNPKRYHSFFEKRALSPQWTEVMRKMLVRLRDRGSYDRDATAYGLSELSSFQFVPEGTVVASRIVPGSAAPLPYMRGFGADDAFGGEAGFDDGTWRQDDDWGDEPAPRAPAPPPRGEKAKGAVSAPAPGPAPAPRGVKPNAPALGLHP